MARLKKTSHNSPGLERSTSISPSVGQNANSTNKRNKARPVAPGICPWCGVTEKDTKMWRRGGLCNACGLWDIEHGCRRPQHLIDRSRLRRKSSDGPSGSSEAKGRPKLCIKTSNTRRSGDIGVVGPIEAPETDAAHALMRLSTIPEAFPSPVTGTPRTPTISPFLMSMSPSWASDGPPPPVGLLSIADWCKRRSPVASTNTSPNLPPMLLTPPPSLGSSPTSPLAAPNVFLGGRTRVVRRPTIESLLLTPEDSSSSLGLHGACTSNNNPWASGGIDSPLLSMGALF